MSESTIVGQGRLPAVRAAGVVLLLLTAPYALLAALLGAQVSAPGLVLEDGQLILPTWFGSDGMWIFLAACLFCAWAGLATVRGWHGWRLLAAVAAWLTIAFAAACVWAWHFERMAGYRPAAAVVLVAAAAFVLWAIHGARPPDAARTR
jgi:hypothetical protein